MKAFSGRPAGELTIEALHRDELTPDDVRIHPETLEAQAMTAAALSQLGISKTVTITSTYDHRVIQGAESGLFLAKIHELLTGRKGFYDSIFSDLEIHLPPLRWAEVRRGLEARLPAHAT